MDPTLETKRSALKTGLKAQFGIMEHLLMAVLILMIVVAALFFLIGFQSARSKGTELREDVNRIITASNIIAKSSILTKGDFVFDDSKLAGFSGAYQKEGCEQVKRLIGEACITIDKTLLTGEKNECDPVNFAERGTECNSWTICGEVCLQLESKSSRGISLPINIFRKLENRMDLGLMVVRMPS